MLHFNCFNSIEVVLYYVSIDIHNVKPFYLLSIWENIHYHLSKTGKFSKAIRHIEHRKYTDLLGTNPFRNFVKIFLRMINSSRKS